MTAKEYLSQLITMDNAINRKQQRLMTLRDVAMNTTPNYSGETVQHTRNKNPLENIMTVKRGDILRWNLILQYGIFIKCT